MKNLFANLYERVLQIYNLDNQLIFDNLFDKGGYVWLGLIFILIPLLMWAVYYFVWKYPYGIFWHWLTWLIITSLVVGIITWRVAEGEIFTSNNQALNDALADPTTDYLEFASTLPIKYAIYNSLFALVLGFIYSLVLKRWSKIQIHLPF